RMAHARKGKHQEGVHQLHLFGGQDQRLLRWIEDLDIPSMTPLEAINELNKLQKYVKKKGNGGDEAG
ncbi:MAG: hypothetical protein JRJ85_28520, partial [Deltaproteobacteria bacterium]|nr:hypothetical protein [Deltaproteobacteria bacterium]